MNATTESQTINPQLSTINRDDEWSRRLDQFREQEWEVAQKLVSAARTLLNAVTTPPSHRTSPAEIARLLEIGYTLARHATGLENACSDFSGPAPRAMSHEVEAELKRIYGKPLPGETTEPPPPKP